MLEIILFLKYLKIHYAFHTQAYRLLMQFIFFLVLKIHWPKVFYYAGWGALLLMFFLFFRNIKIAKNKILKPLKANDVCIVWLKGKSHIQNVILVMLQMKVFLTPIDVEGVLFVYQAAMTLLHKPVIYCVANSLLNCKSDAL